MVCRVKGDQRQLPGEGGLWVDGLVSYWEDSLTQRERKVCLGANMQFSTAEELDGEKGWVE